MPAVPMPPDLTTQAAEFGAPRARSPAPPMASAWQQISHALGWPLRPKIAPIVAADARAAFVSCLDDVPTLQARALCERLSHTRSLSELWHLRPAVFHLLALHQSQAEAERRLALLGRFDRRARPRSPARPTRDG